MAHYSPSRACASFAPTMSVRIFGHFGQFSIFVVPIGTNDNVKGVGVQHSAVLGHSFVAQAYSHIDYPKEWMVRPSPTLMATVLVFLKVLSRRRATMESVAPVSSTPRKT